MSITTSPAPASTDARVPRLTSAEQAVAAARDYAESIAPGVIARDRACGTARELAALDASGLLASPYRRARRRGAPRARRGDTRRSPRSTRRSRRSRRRTICSRTCSRYGHRQPSSAACSPTCSAVRGWATGWPSGAASTPRTCAPGCRPRHRRAAPGRPQVLLHRRDLGPLDRGQRAGRGRSAGAGARRAHRARRPADRRLERDGPAGHGQRQRGVRGAPVDPGLVIPYQSAFQVPQQLGARAQLVHAAIQVGIAGGALRDAGGFVRTRARPFFEAARARLGRHRGPGPAHDPPVRRAGHPGGRGGSAARPGRGDPAGSHPVPTGRHRSGPRLVAAAQAKAFASEVAVEVASDLFALSGASAADERHDLSRHWRNARTHASHDPADWKYHHVGNFLLNHVPPPNHGQV